MNEWMNALYCIVCLEELKRADGNEWMNDGGWWNMKWMWWRASVSVCREETKMNGDGKMQLFK